MEIILEKLEVMGRTDIIGVVNSMLASMQYLEIFKQILFVVESGVIKLNLMFVAYLIRY